MREAATVLIEERIERFLRDNGASDDAWIDVYSPGGDEQCADIGDLSAGDVRRLALAFEARGWTVAQTFDDALSVYAPGSVADRLNGIALDGQPTLAGFE
jgi:hypothetical protein